MRNYIRDNRGSATILMILIAAIILTVGIGFNWLVKEHIRASEGLKNKAEAILKARAAYDTIVYLMLNSRLLPKEAAIKGGEEISPLKTLPLDGRELSLADDVRIRIQESSGLLSLNNINKPAMERLIKRAMDTRDISIAFADNASVAIDSLLDWTSAGNLARINGAKELYYRGLGLPYTSRNYAMQYKEEVKLVRGFNEELYNKIEPYITILPSPGFNPNTASDEVLKAYLDIDDSLLKTFRDFLAKKAVTSNSELFALTGKTIPLDEDGVYFYPSVFMNITVSVGLPKSIYTIKAGLRIIQKVDTPFSVIYWEEV